MRAETQDANMLQLFPKPINPTAISSEIAVGLMGLVCPMFYQETAKLQQGHDRLNMTSAAQKS